MRMLLSTIGSRGEVQPLTALALELRAADQEVRLCVPPDFQDGLQELGFDVVAVGPELRRTASARASPDELRLSVADTVAAQFAALTAASAGCDVIVGAGGLQIAARSVAERRGIAYVFVSYCPATLPSPHHPPLLMPDDGTDNQTRWDREAQRWNDTWRVPLNNHRASHGLRPIVDVRSHVFTDRPWLATDPALGPWPGDENVLQTGAWLLPDDRPLPDDVEAFLDGGEPPVYFGFGSMPATPDFAQVALASARAHGSRAIVSRGWAEVAAVDAPDCLTIGDVNHRALFPRVDAAVHHGGAGTTTVAALAGIPQVLVPQLYDQPYWADQVARLGIGAAHAPGAPTAESLTEALGAALQPEVANRAAAVATRMRTDGTAVTAQHLMASATVSSHVKALEQHGGLGRTDRGPVHRSNRRNGQRPPASHS